MGIHLDTTQWPLLFSYFDGNNTEKDLENYIRSYNAVHRRKELYANITWMRKYSSDPKQVERVRRWLKETETATRDYCVCAGIITQSFGFRFVLSAVFVVKPLPCPYDVTSSFDKALAFVRQVSDKRGLKLPRDVACPWPELT